MSELMVVNILYMVANMFFNSIRVKHEQSHMLFQMLKQLKNTSRNACANSEINQLLKDIDDAISHTNDAVMKQALERAGLTSEEMIALLQESRRYVSNLGRSRHFQSNFNKHEYRGSSNDQHMDYPVNFSPSQSVDVQVDAVLETVKKSLGDPDGKTKLSNYGKQASLQFSGRPENLITELECEKKIASTTNPRVASGIDRVSAFLKAL